MTGEEHNASDQANISKRVYVRLALVPILVALITMVPAGTVRFWEAWSYIGLFVAAAIVAFRHLLATAPEAVARRLQMKERDPNQRRIAAVGAPLLLSGFVVAGLDHRFGWSDLSLPIVLVADAVMLAGYAFVVRTLKENAYASRIVEVQEGQSVISTGPYRFVRHPMYAGASVMYVATGLCLGSVWAVVPFLAFPVVLAVRLHYEEQTLTRELPGYDAYKRKVKYRLIPFVW